MSVEERIEHDIREAIRETGDKKAKEFALKMISKNLPDKLVLECTGISKELLAELKGTKLEK